MPLNAGPSSSLVCNSSQGKTRRGAGVFIAASILALVDDHRTAERGDRLLGKLVVGDLVEGELLVRRNITDVDVVLVGPFGALAHEAGIDRQHAVPGLDSDGE